MGNATFIVWRESVEALLVVGILYAWLSREAPRAVRWLWLGCTAGVALAVVLATAMFSTAAWLQGEALELFQAGMQLVAAALIVHMLWWMRRHAGHLRATLESGARAALDAANHTGIAVLAMIAIAREGAETAVFLYGIAQDQSFGVPALLLSLAAGVGAALATVWLLDTGGRRVGWPIFFRISEIVLLCLGAALLVGGLEKLIGLEYLPPGIDPLWDSSRLLDDSAGPGNWLASLAGYRAQPAATLASAFALYWLLAIAGLRLAGHRAQ